jgi:hypothetical protein
MKNLQIQNLTNIHVEKTRAIFNKKNYAFFEKGAFNLNIIGIRENDIFENTFSDTLNVIYKNKAGDWQILETPWTTLAGTKGHGGEQSPLTGRETGTGVDGVAVLCEQQIRGGFKFVNSFKGFTRYPYLDQIKPALYYRDNDKDGKITKGLVYPGNYKTCIHRMSDNDVQSKEINSDFVVWSQGCSGSPEPDFKKFVNLVRGSALFYGNIFTYTILHRNDFLAI